MHTTPLQVLACPSPRYHNLMISIKNIYCTAQAKPVKHAKTPSNSDSLNTTKNQESKKINKRVAFSKLGCNRFCLCGRRGFLGATLLPLLEQPSHAALGPFSPTDPMVIKYIFMLFIFIYFVSCMIKCTCLSYQVLKFGIN